MQEPIFVFLLFIVRILNYDAMDKDRKRFSYQLALEESKDDKVALIYSVRVTTVKIVDTGNTSKTEKPK